MNSSLAPRRRPRKVMVVDDGSESRERVAKELAERGYEVVQVDSPIGFSRALLRERPEVVLVDLGLTALRGDKLVAATRGSRPYQQLVESGAACALVLLSDQPEEELRELCARCGAQGFLAKSASSEALALGVAGFLRSQLQSSLPPQRSLPPGRG